MEVSTAPKELGEKIVKTYERFKGARVNWETNWEDLSEYFLPNKDDVYGYKMNGERKHNKLYDSTSVQALEMLASSLHGMLTNPSSVWFGLSTGDFNLDKDQEVQQYLQDCTRIMIDTFNGSNFQEEIHETYLDLAGIGTTTLSIEEDDETDVRFHSEVIYSSYVAENYKGVVDTLYKCWKQTLRNIKDEYGDECFKDNYELAQKLRDCPEEKEEIVFGIYPSEEKKGQWDAVWVLKKTKYVLKEKRYLSWPYAVPRWTKLNSEVYGRAPAMKCLSDVKMVNAVMKTAIRGMQKVVDPPVMVPDNGFLLPVKTSPGSTNFYRTGMKDRIELFPSSGARPDIALDFVENIRGRIKEAFFIDQLQLINQRDMTATEVMQRTDERLRFLGPILGRLNNELLKPIIDRTFDILTRRGKMPRPPEVLADNPDLQIVYTSQIAKAQRTAEANTLMKVLQASAPVIEAQPEVMDNIDGDNVLRYNANIFGLPAEMLRAEKEVQGTRQQRAEAQQQAMAAQQENLEADTAQKMAKAQPQ